MEKVKYKTIPAAFIVTAVSILLIQILFFSVLYFYPNEYTLPDPLLRKIPYAEWNWYIAQPYTDIRESTLLQICAFQSYLTLTIWICNVFHIRTSKIRMLAKALLFLASILAYVIPALLMNFYVSHCTLPMTLVPLEILSLLLLVILIVKFKAESRL